MIQVSEDDAATPLTFDEQQGLIPSHITFRHELNEAEQAGILEADRWAFSRRREVLDEQFLLSLHRRMFRKVWRWAGTIRNTPKNIGVDSWYILPELRHLLDDTRYWVQHQIYQPDEASVRFHHRMVFIHPFANGNGRHARLAADLLAVQLGKERFSWGRCDLAGVGEVRRRYVDALRAADRHDLRPLCSFVRS